MTRKRVTVLNDDLNMKIEIYFEDVITMKNWINSAKERELFGKNKEKVSIKTSTHDDPNARLLREYERLEQSKTGKVNKVKYYEFQLPENYKIIIEDFTNSKINRDKRDSILRNTDWLFISDTPIPTKYRVFYKRYRQYLRDYNLELEIRFQSFPNWLKREEPKEFQDGGRGGEMIKKFNYYLGKEDV